MRLAEKADSAFNDMTGTGALDGDSAVEWVYRLSLPRLVVNADLQLLWANRVAETVLASGQMVRRRGETLWFDDHLGQDHWRERLSEVGADLARLVVTDPRGHPNLIIGAFRRSDGTRRDAIFLSLMAVSQSLDLTKSGLAAMFDLTNAERQIAQMLVDLRSPREISESLGVSINTVRTHIRGIYVKLAVSSQRELLRLASTFCMV
ncbi:LuxR C-terminal-related transcriptional regulator [Tsuneonella sp. YG55]|uniref:LuxR C-terminal-related transcriptional regulator n=1 Tax=Tsuneonella litorea TaxID=2976475 RepID=A0A9X2W2W2_9SPHN|nr:LuxR family transcriptional regulator [Tsuneonella litorea]MCT2559224.1 LuxR C-terminal-related transcriptional regulator [Tsuneonella litorea]